MWSLANLSGAGTLQEKKETTKEKSEGETEDSDDDDDGDGNNAHAVTWAPYTKYSVEGEGPDRLINGKRMGKLGLSGKWKKKIVSCQSHTRLEGRWKWVTVSPFHATLKTVPSLPFLGAQVRVFSYYVPTPGVA